MFQNNYFQILGGDGTSNLKLFNKTYEKRCGLYTQHWYNVSHTYYGFFFGEIEYFEMNCTFNVIFGQIFCIKTIKVVINIDTWIKHIGFMFFKFQNYESTIFILL